MMIYVPQPPGAKAAFVFLLVLIAGVLPANSGTQPEYTTPPRVETGQQSISVSSQMGDPLKSAASGRPSALLLAQKKSTPGSENIIIQRATQRFKGDLPDMRKRRLIRALVSYSKSNYFIDKGVARGFEYELLKRYEKHLNQGVNSAYDHIKLAFIPLPFDQLLTALAEGRGDIAAAGLTITPDREKMVSFSEPYLSEVSEVIVRNKGVPDLKSLQDLAGQKIYVRANSSYATHLEALNTTLKTENMAPIKIVSAASILATEDLLEMVHSGVVKLTVADGHIAEAWAEVLPDIRVEKDIPLHSGGQIAWAVRKQNPKLLKSLNGHIQTNKKGSLLGNILFKRYYQNSQWIKNPLTATERKKVETLMRLFEKYSDQYGFDWLAIAAQAYQESELDQQKKSPSGAVGIMQLLPSTAAGEPINIQQIEKIENNIHAGVKYLDFLRERYFSDPAISPAAQVDFSWAAYNAGPAKINRLRKSAGERGLDPNRWFGHVERIAAEKIGRETVSYVANINKYYIAYKLYFHKTAARDKVLKKGTPISNSPDAGPDRMGDTDAEPPAVKESKSATAAGPEAQPIELSSKKATKTSLKKKTKKSNLRFHSVRAGDTLYSIGRQYGLSVQQLNTLNDFGPSGVIHPGDRLLVSKP